LTVSITGQEDEVIDVPFEGIDFRYQAMEVQNCLRAGKLESSVMPLDETVAIMATMDQMRDQWGLRYPTE
jgi:dihydrodiol dehydrogenase / D-xylose 1-dehydrogenase (NADP)